MTDLKLPELPEAVAYARDWHANGETPAKQRNANGRMAWPARFRFLPVTPRRVFPTDAPLHTVAQLQAYATAAVLAERAAAEADARRYRWLRENLQAIQAGPEMPINVCAIAAGTRFIASHIVDELIDAAMGDDDET